MSKGNSSGKGFFDNWVNSAEAANAGFPQDLKDEKTRVDASFEAGKKAYVNGGDNASQKAAAKVN